jgi:hypothetical protein
MSETLRFTTQIVQAFQSPSAFGIIADMLAAHDARIRAEDAKEIATLKEQLQLANVDQLTTEAELNDARALLAERGTK